MYIGGTECESVNWIQLAQDNQIEGLFKTVMNLQIPYEQEIS